MNNKLIAIIIVAVLIVVGIVGYVLFAGQAAAPSGTPPLTQTGTPPTAGNTYGMTQYTDPTYGFSFWYPSTLQVTPTIMNDSTQFPGGVAVEMLQVGPMGGVTVYVVNSPTSNITDEPADHASPIAQTQYFYDSTSGQWMVAYPQGRGDGQPATTSTADVSNTTMSGLIMLPSGRRFDTTIIPLSNTQFLVIGDGGGSSFTPQLTATVTQGGASVDATTQANALQAEATAAANQ